MTRALLAGDAELFEEQFQTFVTNLLSYRDPGALDPERAYHGFVVRLLAVLELEYQVRSNRDSGLGRPDVTTRPMRAGKPGVVLELKVAKTGKTTLGQALAREVAQLKPLDHGAQLRAAPMHGFAVAFDGKEVRVRASGT